MFKYFGTKTFEGLKIIDIMFLKYFSNLGLTFFHLRIPPTLESAFQNTNSDTFRVKYEFLLLAEIKNEF